MACCVLLAGGLAALIALKRLLRGHSVADPRAWRLETRPTTGRSDD